MHYAFSPFLTISQFSCSSLCDVLYYQETFTSNVAQLSRGVPFERLPLIDNKRSLKILEEMISRQTDPDNDDVSLYASGGGLLTQLLSLGNQMLIKYVLFKSLST